MSGGTPIKFGPEWLRNFGRANESTRTDNQNGSGQSTTGGRNHTMHASGSSRPTTSTAVAGYSGTLQNPMRDITPNPSVTTTTTTLAQATGPNTFNTSAIRTTSTPRILMANSRYGREEMLALFDRGADAPDQLRSFDTLYHQRGKTPSALNVTEDEQNIAQEGLRGGVPITGGIAGDRNSMGRGRGATPNYVKRATFMRTPSTNRGWHKGRTTGAVPVAGYNEPPSLRPWSTSNGAGPSRTTATTEHQSEWTTTKLFRNRRQNQNTNWRQSGREEGDHWRMQDHGNRASVPERDWSERPIQERPQSWGSSRRSWADNQNNDDIPEWANDNTEAGAGTFDASGAFHGYSNDDSNIPRQQETSYPLSRSFTNTGISRSKTAEEGSEEWSSEKGKKGTTKRPFFELFSTKYAKANYPDANDDNLASNSSKGITFGDLQDIPDNLDVKEIEGNRNPFNEAHNKFSENKTFNAPVEPVDNKVDANNFQSVMITPNTTLRQKHQNVVPATIESTIRPSHRCGLLKMVHDLQQCKQNMNKETPQSDEKNLVKEIFNIALEDNDIANMNVTPNVPHGSSVGMCVIRPLGATTPVPVGMPMSGFPNQAMGVETIMPNQANNNIQNIGIQNPALNSSLGLPLVPPNNGMVLSLQGVLPQVINPAINPAMNATLQQHSNVMGAYPQNVPLPVIPPQNIANPTLYLEQNNPQVQQPVANGNPQGQQPEIQNNMFPIYGGENVGPQQTQYRTIYRNMSAPPLNPPNTANLFDFWYYEDPEKNIQGPFASKEMLSWYTAGFFTSNLMVRRACEATMRPLASYGPIVPFAQLEIFPVPNYEPRPPVDTVNQTIGLGLGDRQICSNYFNRMDLYPFGLRPPIVEPRPMNSLWSQPSTSQDVWWMQSSRNCPESRVNNLPMYFWDPEPSGISSNNILPEGVIKMKTEDEILAQIRGPPYVPVSRVSFSEGAVPPAPQGSNTNDGFVVSPIVDLTKIQSIAPPAVAQKTTEFVPEIKETLEEIAQKIPEPHEAEIDSAKLEQLPFKLEEKVQKAIKIEAEKVGKNKDNGIKMKPKKSKDDKKDEIVINTEEPVTKPAGKRSVESSPSKSLKDVKPLNKKELEKEKKELIKGGFTIVKGAEKNNNKEKENKKKAAEEAERKRLEEKMVADEEKKKSLATAAKKQQEQQQKQAAESVTKKAPWSAVATKAIAANYGRTNDGLTLSEIQKLEREKKLEQMKEQQQMMHIIAQQQAAALAREQEMQAGLGWAKKKNASAPSTGQTLAEIQSETRRQAAAAVAQEKVPPVPVVTTNHLPWGNSSNGFWDCPTQPLKTDSVKMESSKPVDINKNKFKVPAPVNVAFSTKKEVTPAMEFDSWCSQALGIWSSKIDVPTFMGFLKDIESPYEVKDYVKCYLGESKDSSDFSRQFLERRSKLLRVSMVTPSDDLCSPALAINPRNTSVSDYQEVKGKGKKAKKNKMMKVDARILGFSVTAAEDRINVGDIDTA